jgi:uncharacterized membrane protein YcaP (DUF421 family)
MWRDIWHLQVSVDEKVVRSVLIYAFVVLALRIFGKRELGQTNTLDLVVLLLMANAVQNGIIGNDVSVTGAVIGASVLFTLNNVLARAQYRFPILTRVLEGQPDELISDGKPNMRALRHEQISLPELRAIARRQGFMDLGDVETAILETNGVVTMWGADEPRQYHPAVPGGLRIGKHRRSPEHGG